MKVIRVYKSVKSSGGVHRRLQELLPELRQHAEVRVLCYRERGDRAAALEARDVAVDLVPMGSKWSPANVARYVEYFRRQRPDVVHTHEYTANTLAIVAARSAGVPVCVRHLHTLAPWGWGGRLRTALRVRADRRAALRADTTLAVSAAVRRAYLERSGLPGDSCRVLYNGLDLAAIAAAKGTGAVLRRAWQIADDELLVGVVGRIGRGKGLNEFLAAAAQIAAQVPKARFAVVGEGAGRGELETRAQQLGLGDRVVFTGHRDDVPRVLAALDLFLFPAIPDEAGRIQDGLPGVVIEAQAAGLPVVAFGLPMMDEVLQDGSTGSLVPVGDVPALAAAACGWLRRPEQRRDCVARAAEFAQRFSLQACVANTLQLYRELGERRGSAG